VGCAFSDSWEVSCEDGGLFLALQNCVVWKVIFKVAGRHVNTVRSHDRVAFLDQEGRRCEKSLKVCCHVKAMWTRFE
jgi:hypothetical protein